MSGGPGKNITLDLIFNSGVNLDIHNVADYNFAQSAKPKQQHEFSTKVQQTMYVNNLDVGAAADKQSLHSQVSSCGDIYSTDRPLDEKGWKDERQAWDMFKMTNSETRFQESHAMMKCFQQCVLMLAHIISFLLVFSTALVSYGSFIFMTSNIKLYYKTAMDTSSGGILLRVSSNWTTNRKSSEELLGDNASSSGAIAMSLTRKILPPFYEKYLCSNTNITRLPYEWFAEPGPRWMWIVFVAVCIPQIFTFIKSMKKLLLRKRVKPTPLLFIVTFLAETMHTIAIGIFVFSVLPNVDSVLACMLPPAICLVPAILQPLSRPIHCKNYILKILLDIFALCGQVSAIVYWVIQTKNPYYLAYGRTDCWKIALALGLISFLYWDNYIEKTIPIAFLARISRYKELLRKTRPGMHVFLSLWNILILFALMIMFSTNYYSLKDMFDFKRVFWYEAELLNAVDQASLDGNADESSAQDITSSLTSLRGPVSTIAATALTSTIKAVATTLATTLASTVTTAANKSGISKREILGVSNITLVHGINQRLVRIARQATQTPKIPTTMPLTTLTTFFDDTGDSSSSSNTDPAISLLRYNDYLIVLVIQACSALLLYYVSAFSCKTVLQKFSFAFPILAALPIIGYIMMFLTEMRLNDMCFFANVVPSHLFWNLVDFNPLAKPGKKVNVFQNPDSLLSYDNNRNDTMGITGYFWLVWLLSMCWITSHIWYPKGERLEQTSKLFTQPMYCPVFTAVSLLLSRARETTEGEAKNQINIDDSIDDLDSNKSEVKETSSTNVIPRIYFCATMWHENLTEITQLMKSVCRCDIDQNNRRMRRNYMKIEEADYYEFEVNILFDDSMSSTVTKVPVAVNPLNNSVVSNLNAINGPGTTNDSHMSQHLPGTILREEKVTTTRPNQFVKLLFRAMKDAAETSYDASVTLSPPMKILTPYGGRLVWKLPGKNKIVVHLKDKKLIRHKKRWSQVMYMYYLLGYRHNKRLAKSSGDPALSKEVADNTFILALDGDVDFQPLSVIRLVDLMKKNVNVASACGRIHPAGSGPLVWYQKFEYALGHWLQKAAEHMIGCVLCSPGCFSLFRGSALMADNVARTYTKMAEEPWQMVQYDQGEDRWLCTLILQQGYRIEYSAASDAVTYSPEGFDEFFNQRRRWIPSTMANILDLLRTYRKTVALNETITFSYILYQAMMFVSTLIGPGVIILLLVGSISATFYLSLYGSIAVNVLPVLIFIVMCFKTQTKHQLLFAKIMAAVYAIAMLSFCIRAMLQIHDEGIQSPAAIFIIILVGVIFAASILHPEEFKNVIYGLLYLLVVPTMYLMLIIYSLCNLHIVSWGTREVAKVQLDKTDKKKKNWIRTLWDDIKSLKEYIPCIDEDKGHQPTFSDHFKKSFRASKKNLSPNNKKVGELPPGIVQTNANGSSNTQGGVDLTGLIKRTDGHLMLPEIVSIAAPSNHGSEGANATNSSNMPLNVVNAAPTVNFVIPSITIQKDEPKPLEGEKKDMWWNSNWMEDPELPPGPVGALTGDEIRFWEELIEKYLQPLEYSEEKKKEIAEGLLALRNKAAFGFLLANLIFIIIILMLQANKDTLNVKWNIPGSKKSLKLEPLSLALLAFFVIILGIQFIAMLFHRWNTLLHILASTELFCFKSDEKEIPVELHSPEALKKHNLARFRHGPHRSFSNMADNVSVATKRSKIGSRLHMPGNKKLKGLTAAVAPKVANQSQSSEELEVVKKTVVPTPKTKKELKRLNQNQLQAAGTRGLFLSASVKPTSTAHHAPERTPKVAKGQLNKNDLKYREANKLDSNESLKLQPISSLAAGVTSTPIQKDHMDMRGAQTIFDSPTNTPQIKSTLENYKTNNNNFLSSIAINPTDKGGNGTLFSNADEANTTITSRRLDITPADLTRLTGLDLSQLAQIIEISNLQKSLILKQVPTEEVEVDKQNVHSIMPDSTLAEAEGQIDTNELP